MSRHKLKLQSSQQGHPSKAIPPQRFSALKLSENNRKMSITTKFAGQWIPPPPPPKKYSWRKASNNSCEVDSVAESNYLHTSHRGQVFEKNKNLNNAKFRTKLITTDHYGRILGSWRKAVNQLGPRGNMEGGGRIFRPH